MRMLRMYIVQQCFGLSDEGTEDVVYDSQAIWHFIVVDLNVYSALDTTTLPKFGRLLSLPDQYSLLEEITSGIDT